MLRHWAPPMERSFLGSMAMAGRSLQNHSVVRCTLPCETWNAHRARSTIALLDKETLAFIQPQLWPPNSPDLNPVGNSVWEILQERCTKHASVICNYRWCHWWMAATMTWSSLTLSILSCCFSASRSVMYVLYTFSWSIPTCCNQRHSNPMNLEATVEME